MPGPLITRQDIANGAVSAQPRKFSAIGGKSRAARVFFYFKTADIPVGMPHALGRTPDSWRIVTLARDAGVPGTVYSPTRFESPYVDSNPMPNIFNLGRNYIVLACSTANTWAEIEIT